MNNTKAVSLPTPIRILHVDDDAGFLELARQIIKISGDFIVDGASSAEEASEKLKTQPYDVVLCDYEMPGKDGLEFLRELREQKNDVAFMLFTGKGHEEVAITALNLGADGYYIKHGSTETVFGELLQGIKTVVEEHRRSEEALRSSEARYRALFEQVGDYIFLMEIPPGQLPIIRDINSAATRVLGYLKEELVGKPISFIDPSLDIEKTSMLVCRLQEKKQYTFETCQRRKDGSFINVEALVKVVKIGSDIWFLSIHRDITDRKHAEEALRRSDERFRTLYDNNHDAVVILSPDGKIISANATACRMFGWSEEELKAIGREGIVVVDERVKRALMNREATGQVKAELTFKRKDGSLFEGDLIATQFMEPNGAISISVIVRDISPRKRAEEELKESSEKIVTMNEKLRVVGGLTRHDVKNKLSIINANVYLLKKKLTNDPELLTYLDAISLAVASSDKLLEFSRIYEKIGAEQLTEINVWDCFNEAVALLPNLAGIEIVNECQGLTVMADSLLRQLFYNLLDNSSKHGVKVTQIKLYYSKSESGLKLYYADNGVGISAENRPKLFTEGFTTGNGSGLGLRLTLKMAEVYGWSIAETGVPGQGVRFEISIK